MRLGKREKNMGLAEKVTLLRHSVTLADVLKRLEDKGSSVEPFPYASNVMSLCQERRRRRQSVP